MIPQEWLRSAFITQFEFWNNFGTRDASFGVNVLIQRYRDNKVDSHLYFIDYENGIDRIIHQSLLATIHQKGLDLKDIRKIKNQCWNQKVIINILKRCLTELHIVYSIFLIYTPNTYLKKLFRWNEQVINNICYNDDTGIIAPNIGDSQTTMEKISNKGKLNGLKIT